MIQPPSLCVSCHDVITQDQRTGAHGTCYDWGRIKEWIAGKIDEARNAEVRQIVDELVDNVVHKTTTPTAPSGAVTIIRAADGTTSMQIEI